MFKLASCKHMVLLSLTIVLKFIINLLGLTKQKRSKVDDHTNQHTVLKEDLDSLQRDTRYFPTWSRKEQKGRHDGGGSSGDASGESAEEEPFPIPRKLHTPRSRRFLRYGISTPSFQGKPFTSSPININNRQYSSSSGFSGSDVILSEMSSFGDHSLNAGITKESVIDAENIKLRLALDSLIKEKIELQEKLKHQQEQQCHKQYFQNVKLDTDSEDKHLFKSTYSTLNSQDCRNIYLEGCSTQCNYHRSDSVTNTHKQLNHVSEYNGETCLRSHTSSRRHSSARAADVAHASVLDNIMDKDDMLEKMRNLKKDNVRLKEYINGLLFMVLENSPSLLEAKQHTHNM